MVEKPPSATEEQGATPVAPPDAALVKEPAHGFIQAARGPLTAEEAASPAGIRWLAYEAERLERESEVLRIELVALREKYDDIQDENANRRVEVETLNGKLGISGRNEWLAFLCLTGGGVGLGATPAWLAVTGATATAIVGLVMSAVLVLGGLFLRNRK